MTNVNDQFAVLMGEIASYYQRHNDEFRYKTYDNAAQQLRNHSHPIASGAQAQKIRGIGKSVATDIDQYLKTGKIKRLEDLRRKYPDRDKTIDLFNQVYGIGIKTALKLYEKGYRSIEDLAAHYTEFTPAQQWGIFYFYQIKERIPRSEMNIINERIHTILDPLNLQWEMAGSYRRQEPTSGDVDIFVRETPQVDMNHLIDILTRSGFLFGQLAMGPQKFMGLLRLSDQHNARRIDILIIPPHEWWYTLLYFTGSARFNVLMRQRAIELGLKLNEKEMTRIDDPSVSYPAHSEQDIFTYLGVRYIEPIDRVRNMAILPLLQ